MITDFLHPEYIASSDYWNKWRLTYEGGPDFIHAYLQKFSNREDSVDFLTRKATTYCPRFAGAALDEVKNAIYQRMVDITREGGSPSYQKAIKENVDLQGRSMNNFIGTTVLTELLQMGKVGIYVDKPQKTSEIITPEKDQPYLYIYPVENIRAWINNPHNPNEFDSVVLQDEVYDIDEDTGYVRNIVTEYRHMWVNSEGYVNYRIYGQNGLDIKDEGYLEIHKIPFVCAQISNSLLADIADYQIALLNLASSDLGYVLKSNFPFYVEQFDPNAFFGKPEIEEGASPQGADQKIEVGIKTGRGYPLGTNEPSFIHPSPEPIMASMKKQDQLKQEIRLLLNLTITNLEPQRASSESKHADNIGLDAGLSYIGMALELAERQIASLWEMYENSKTVATINYPETYSLKSDADRRAEAKDLSDLKDRVTSSTFKKEIDKQTARILLGPKISKEKLKEIETEIEQGVGVTATSSDVALDVENMLVSAEYASQVRGYPKGEAEKAKEEHMERLKRIQDAQTPRDQASVGSAARGLPDADPEPAKSGSNEKAESRNNDTQDQVKDRTRGEGR